MNGLFLLDPVVPGQMVWLRPQGGLSRQARHPDHPGDQDRRSEDTYAAAPRHTVGILTEALSYVGAEVVATILAPSVHRRDEVRERTDLMKAARNAGHAAIHK
jgi:hypothetical protein